MKGSIRVWGCAAIAVFFSAGIAACGGASPSTTSASTTSVVVEEIVVDSLEQSADDVEVDESALAEEIRPPSGELRIASTAPVTSFNPAAVNSAQFGYLIPVYDTLTRQSAELKVVPSLATSWIRPNATTWQFTVRDDVVFHDGTPFDAQVAVDNIEFHRNFEGNPNADVWAGLVEARVVNSTTFQVEFSTPNPEFPLTMSNLPGMMINPNFLDGAELSRNPQGSGPWRHSEADSQAGLSEVYVVNEGYWNPVDQGVERILITVIPENNARLNALITGEVDISDFTQDSQVERGLEAGMNLVSVPNFFPFLLITDRNGELNPALGDERVRRAIALSIDRNAYNDAIHAGRADPSGGIYPSNFGQFHWSEFDDKYSYDPTAARELLAEAGYPDGVTIEMPIMPAIAPQVELIAQMLGASGIRVDLKQINNGELGPRVLSREYGIAWLRALLDHPAGNLPALAVTPWDTFKVGDLEGVLDLVKEANVVDDPDEARELYARATAILLDSGAVIPLGHAGQNAMYSQRISGVVMGLGMQSPYPHGVRFSE